MTYREAHAVPVYSLPRDRWAALEVIEAFRKEEWFWRYFDGVPSADQDEVFNIISKAVHRHVKAA